MFKKISKISEIDARLEKEGKTRLLNSDSDLSKLNKLNKHMEEVRKDYQLKESKSLIAASEVILNA
ncbi:MAG: hypothetical protein K9G70_03770 [Prolixibacteraceae bacterium]|nr:hypothetical protein [Prolixibacteraceae bacterium]